MNVTQEKRWYRRQQQQLKTAAVLPVQHVARQVIGREKEEERAEGKEGSRAATRKGTSWTHVAAA